MKEPKNTPLEDELQTSYIDYAMSVIIGRAIPDARDGLKPVQRRILFSMYSLKNFHNQPTKKSARIVGEVIGKYHPHGDLAVYDALVRMAQDFSMHHLLVEGQGNMGCFTKDTKVKLADGRDLSFGELVHECNIGKRNYAFTFNEKTRSVEVAEIMNPRLTRRNSRLVAVKLDAGETVRCTPDHRFMTSSSTYKQAKDLVPGDLLMAMPSDAAKLQAVTISEHSILENPRHSSTAALQAIASAEVATPECRKVIEVVQLQELEDTYDLTIEPWHNFALSSGIFVHNSIDGDPPAAQRYTEVRLTKIAEEMLSDIDKETVEFVPNFDNTEKEPLTLPSKVPNLLVNGASGIAVGVATSIPPHNLSEVCDAIVYALDHKETAVEDLLGIVKGPDFPTGGIAIMSQNAYAGYRHGRGQTTVRAKAEVDEKGRRIIIKEIPYNVNKASLIQTIAEKVREKQITGIKDLRDESDKHGIRITVDLKEDANPEQVLNMLYKHTQMEVTFPIINLAVVGKSLKSFNLLTMVQTFIEYRRDIVLKRSRFELKVASDRLHIVEGLLLAIDRIDSIIKDIKESGEVAQARSRLMSEYGLSEKQANAILDMKLSRLTHLENESLNREKAELMEKVSYYKAIIEQPGRVDQIIKEETQEVKRQFGKPRKTEILNIDEPIDINDEDLISNERVTVIMTNKGYVKRQNINSFKEQGRGGRGVIVINLTEGDYVKEILTCNNKDYLLCISNTGRAYWIKAYNIPEGSRYGSGKAIVNLLNLAHGESIVVMLDVKNFENTNIIFLTAKGIVKKTDAALFSRPRSNGVRAINLRPGDEISDVILYSGDKYLTILTKLGKAIKFEESELRQIGRTASGVRGIRLRGNDAAKNVISATDTGSILTVTENGYGKLTDISKYRTQSRGGSGVISIKVNEKTGNVSKALFVSGEQNLMLINSKGISITIPVESIRITGRAASGVRLMKLEEGAKVVDARVIRKGEQEIDTGAQPAPPA
ncbi:MAG: DNA gyrase subunit A [Candidatus Micrarchaeaceae archaeon]